MRNRFCHRPNCGWLVALAALPAMIPAATEANAPVPAPRPTLATAAIELVGQGFAIRVPGADWQAKPGQGEVLLPAPIIAVRSTPQAPWLGCGYLDTASAATALKVEGRSDSVTLDYAFADGGHYRAVVTVRGALVLIDEIAQLGPRDAWVFDAFYDWQPGAGIALARGAATANFLTLPCHYDRVEAAILAHQPGPQIPTGLAVLSAAEDRREILAVWAREAATWRNPGQLGIELWQRRQRGNDVRSRHVLGPDVKSDGTPNPRTAGLIGTSLYEGHVTLEFLLGVGERHLALAVVNRPDQRDGIIPALAKAMEAAP